MLNRRTGIAVAALAALAFCLSLVVGHAFFENLSINNDEAVYVLEARMFTEGDLTLSDSAHGDAFRPWMSGRVGDDRLVLVEQPTLPALMALSDLLFGTMRVAVALVAAGAVVAVFAMTRTLLRDDRVALVAAACFVLSPLVIIQSAMYLSYVLAVTLAATAIALATKGLDTAVAGGSARWWLIGAGATEGLLLFTRPLEGIVLAVLLGGWLFVRASDWRRALGSGAVMGLAIVPIMLLAFLYNIRTTGDPFVFALWTIGGDDSFGFGYRSIAEHANHIYVGPWESWLALRVNVRAFPHWIIGGLVAIPVALWGGWLLWKRSRRVLVLLVAMVLAYPFAYFFYYGNYLIIEGRNFYGPHYYLALLLPTMVLLGVALVDLASRRWPVLATVLVAMMLGTAIELPAKIRTNRRTAEQLASEVAAVRSSVEEPAIVVLPASPDGPYVLHPWGAFSNPPDLDAPVLFAADLGARNLALVDRFPDRSLYRFEMAATADAVVPSVERLRPVRGDRLRFVVDAPAVDHVAIGDHVLQCTRGATRLEVDVTVDTAEVSGCTATTTSLRLHRHRSSLRFRTGRHHAPRQHAVGGRPVDSADLVYAVGASAHDGSGTEVLALAPPQLFAPIGPDGVLETVSPGLVPWLSTSVAATARPG